MFKAIPKASLTFLPVGLTCGCDGGSGGKVWDDLLRGGGWGADWGVSAATGTRGSCIF